MFLLRFPHLNGSYFHSSHEVILITTRGPLVQCTNAQMKAMKTALYTPQPKAIMLFPWFA